MSWFGSAATAFAAVFPAELPDKSMVATIVLTTRTRRPFSVWAGVAAAFSVQVVVAVTAGRLLTLAPGWVTSAVTTVLFSAGAVVMWRTRDVVEADVKVRAGRAVTLAFVTVLVAEFGDLTQLTTAGLAARSDSVVGVALGALVALWSVAALAAAFGQRLSERLPVKLLQRGAAMIMAVLAVWSALGLIG